MQNSQPQTDPITVVISEIVEPDRVQEYETWTRGINQAAQQFHGFLGAETIRPRDHDYPEYVVIVKFDNYVHFRDWVTSSTYREWMEKSQDLVAKRSRQQLPSGLELWFTLPQNRVQKPAAPAYYKQVILGVLGVYPLILLANAVLNPVLKGFHPLLGLLISVTFVSALLTHPVMPWLSKILGFWLYPESSRKNRHLHNKSSKQ